MRLGVWRRRFSERFAEGYRLIENKTEQSVHPLIEAWQRFDATEPPYFLRGDKGGDKAITDKRWASDLSWESYSRNHNFGEPDDGRFHLGLLPVPFQGNLAHASVYILLLNPGFGPHDYFAEYSVPAFRQARLENLKQTSECQFIGLSPEFSWHGGFRYWHARLSSLISEFAKNNHISYGDSRRFFASEIASIELVPYHSKTFALPRKLLNELLSVQLAQRFAKDVLLPRAKENDCLLVVTRSSRSWDLEAGQNVVIYEGSETRSAHLSPRSRGGGAILRFLQQRYHASTA